MDSFVHFAALPTELRLLIWKLARQPRVVEVWYDADAEYCRTTAHPPAILHVNRESRAEALRNGWYHQAFRTRAHSHRYLYFSSTLDVLYLPRHGLMGYDDTARDFTVHVRDTAEHVRALAIDHVRPDTIRPWEPYNKLMLLLSFPNVRETMLVVGGGTAAHTTTATATSASHWAESSLSASAASSSSSHDTRAVRQRAQGTIEGVSSPTVDKDGDDDEVDVDVELVDPQGDLSEIMDVINNVIMSFSLEIQAVEAVAEDTHATNDPQTNSNAINDADSAFAPFLAKSDACSASRALPHLPYLIPKAIEYHQHQRQCQRQRELAIRA